MMNALQSVLSKCDELGISLRFAEPDRIIFRTGERVFPDELRDSLRSLRPALLELLRIHARPEPAAVWLVAANLDIALIPFEMVPQSGTVHFGERPYYTLTPKLWAEMLMASDAMFRRPDGSYPTTDPNYLGVSNRLAELTSYIVAYFRPDQIERAMTRRAEVNRHGKRTKADSQPHAACS